MEYINTECGFIYTEKDKLYHSYDDKPAIIFKSGSQHWYKDGKLHRDNDLPAIIKHDGIAVWYMDNKLVKRCSNYLTKVKRAN